MATNAPSIAIGRGVKVYQSPNFGRTDATCTAVNNTTGVISAKLVKTGVTLTSIKHVLDASASDTKCWRELPMGYAAGSGGQ